MKAILLPSLGCVVGALLLAGTPAQAGHPRYGNCGARGVVVAPPVIHRPVVVQRSTVYRQPAVVCGTRTYRSVTPTTYFEVTEPVCRPVVPVCRPVVYPVVRRTVCRPVYRPPCRTVRHYPAVRSYGHAYGRAACGRGGLVIRF